jgi:adhesin HecA-like repeat protein
VTSNGFWNGPVGPNNAGSMTAQAMTLGANGSVTNLGRLQSGTSLKVTGESGVTNAGSIVTDGSLLIDVAGLIDNRKEIAADTLTLKGGSYTGSAASSLNAFDVTVTFRERSGIQARSTSARYSR